MAGCGDRRPPRTFRFKVILVEPDYAELIYKGDVSLEDQGCCILANISGVILKKRAEKPGHLLVFPHQPGQKFA